MGRVALLGLALALLAAIQPAAAQNSTLSDTLRVVRRYTAEPRAGLEPEGGDCTGKVGDKCTRGLFTLLVVDVDGALGKAWSLELLNAPRTLQARLVYVDGVSNATTPVALLLPVANASDASAGCANVTLETVDDCYLVNDRDRPGQNIGTGSFQSATLGSNTTGIKLTSEGYLVTQFPPFDNSTDTYEGLDKAADITAQFIAAADAGRIWVQTVSVNEPGPVDGAARGKLKLTHKDSCPAQVADANATCNLPPPAPAPAPAPGGGGGLAVDPALVDAAEAASKSAAAGLVVGAGALVAAAAALLA